MRKYNHSLDFTVLALASAANGDYAAAGKLLIKASKAHDVKHAVAVLEASNAQAFAAQEQAKVQAASKGKTNAASRVKATAGKKPTQVKAFDMGDEGDMEDLMGDEDEEVEAAEHDEEDEEHDDDHAFASMLASMTDGKSKRK